MAQIQKDSAPCAKSELDLFLLPPTQTVIEKGYYAQYFPVSNIEGENSPLEFNISGNGDEYMDLGSSYFHVKVKIVKADGKPLVATDKVAPINLFLHSLFSQVDVSLNERVISSSTNTYPYRAYIETLLNFGEDAKKSFLSSECFYKDTDPGDINTSGANEGLKKRYNLTKNSQVLDMIGPLHCDIFQQNRLLLNLVDLKIKMLRSTPSFCLLAAEPNANYKVVLEHASLYIRKVKPFPGVSLGHAKALEKTHAKYPIDRILIKTYSISKGSWSFIQDNVFLGPMPKRIILTLIPNASLNGQFSSNPFCFNHQDVKFLSLYIDGQPYPAKPLEMDYNNQDYIRAYHTLFSETSQDRGLFLDREEYAHGNTLYAFNLTPDLCEGSHLKLQRQGNLRVEIKFSKELSETLSVLIFAIFENVIEISKARHVLCDFAN